MSRTFVWLLASGFLISGTLGYMTWVEFQPVKSRSSGPQSASAKDRGSLTGAYSANTVVAHSASVNETVGEFTKLVSPGQKLEATDSTETETGEADICAKFFSIAELSDASERDAKLKEFAGTLSGEEIGRVLDRLVETQYKPAVNELRNALVRLWTGREPASAAAWVMHLPAGAAASELLNQVAITWANDDLDSAVGWVDKLPEADQRKNAVRTAISYEAARSNELVAVTLATQIPEAQGGGQVLDHAVRQWAASTPDAAISWASQVTDENLRAKLMAAISVEWSAKDPMSAGTLAVTSLKAGRTQDDAIVAIVQRWAKQDPQAAADWVNQFPDGTLKRDASESIAEVAKLQ